MKKTRIDKLLLDRGLVDSRERARALIMAGDVLVGDVPVLKAGASVEVGSSVRLRRPPHPYVSRGGVKLEGALRGFGLDPSGRIAADVGSSTGGFTDCLLRAGALRVWAIDVDTRQLDWRLRADPRVRTVEGNARNLERGWLEDPVDLVTMDVSFISATRILPALRGILPAGGDLIVLVKPQFEVGREQVGKGGIVRDPALHRQAVDAVIAGAAESGFGDRGRCRSPIAGKQGNQEFFVWFRSL